MTAYTVHFFDEHEHARGAVQLDCRCEDEALAHAAAIRHKHALEVWSADRLVWRFEPQMCPA